MMKGVWHMVCLGILGISMGCGLVKPPSFPTDRQERILVDIATDTSMHRIVLAAENDSGAVFELHSKRGIGEARIRFTAGKLPRKIRFKVFLGGLESLIIRRQALALRIEIPTSGGPAYPVIQHVRTSASETQPWKSLTAKDLAHWSQVRVITQDAEKAEVPLRNGYFEIELPVSFLKENSRTLILEWIDFYR